MLWKLGTPCFAEQYATTLRRPFLRFYACGEDLSNAAPDTKLPEKVVFSKEPFLIIGAIAGG
jgi:sulfur-carrier protein